MLKFLIGIGIPYAAVIGMLPWVAKIDRVVWGIPFIYAWIFSWFVLTALCLCVCWYCFDRNLRDEDDNLPTDRPSL